MKVLIVDNMFSELDSGLNSAGGFERRNLTDAFLLAENGKDDVYYTHAGPKLDIKIRDAFPFTPVRVHDVIAESAQSPAKWRNEVKKRILEWIAKKQPDVVLFGSNTMMSLAAEICKTTPMVVHVASYLTGNGFIDSGRMQAFHRISETGGYFVFNTEGTHSIFMGQAKEQSRKLGANPTFADKKATFMHFTKLTKFADFVNAHNMGVGLVGKQEDQPIRSDDGYVVIASRADPAKMVHKFADIKVPTRIYWKERAVSHKNDYMNTSIAKFKLNKNIEVIVNADYSKIMRGFSSARCCFVTWPDETYGLTAFEAGSFGVPSVVFRRNTPEDVNCTVEFLSKVYKPKTVCYKSKTWKADCVDAYERCELSKPRRAALAAKFGEVYSQSNYIKEKRTVLKQAIKKWDSQHG